MQISPDLGLVQSSTAADQIPFKFDKSQEHMVAGSYIEFAQRAVLPEFQHLKVSFVAWCPVLPNSLPAAHKSDQILLLKLACWT